MLLINIQIRLLAQFCAKMHAFSLKLCEMLGKNIDRCPKAKGRNGCGSMLLDYWASVYFTGAMFWRAYMKIFVCFFFLVDGLQYIRSLGVPLVAETK